MSEPLHAAVVGVGHLGFFHAQKYASLKSEGIELSALVDPRIEENTKVKEAFPRVPRFSSLRDCLAAMEKGQIPRLSLASVASITSEHVKLGLELLDAGVALLIEKPIALTTAEALRLVEAGEKKKIVLAVGQVERYRAAEVFSMLGSGPKFIECHRLSPFPQRSTDIDVVLDLMIHDIDLMLAMVNSDIVSIHGAGLPVLTPYLDIANARIEFANGCVCNLTASRVSIQRTRKFRIFSGEQYISLDLGAGTFERFGHDAHETNLMEAIKHQSGKLGVTDALLEEISDFIKAVRTGGTPLVTGRDGMRALEVAEKVRLDIQGRSHKA